MLYYGVEIEFSAHASEREVKSAFENEGLTVHVGDNDPDCWTLKYDAGGYEIVSPPIGGLDELRRQVQCFERAMVSLDAFVRNSGQGYHLHISPGLNGFSESDTPALTKFAERWVNHQPLMNAMLPVARRGNYTWCQDNIRPRSSPFTTEGNMSWGRLSRDYQGNDRYRKLNFDALYRHGTVEIRAMTSTLDADQIMGFAQYITELYETSVTMTTVKRSPRRSTPEECFTRLAPKLSPEVAAWVKAKANLSLPTSQEAMLEAA